MLHMARVLLMHSKSMPETDLCLVDAFLMITVSGYEYIALPVTISQ